MKSDRLLRRWKKDYLREPTRAATILSYVTEFLGRRGQCNSVAKMFEHQFKTATDWESAQFLRVFRRMTCMPDDFSNRLLVLCRSQRTNWYVRQQAILNVGWFWLEAEAKQLAEILDSEWDDEVRRAVLTVLFLLPHDEERSILRRASRDLSPKVSRMANFILRLRKDSSLAQQTLKQFYGPNEVFFGDNFWKLHQVRWVRDVNTRKVCSKVLARSRDILTSPLARKHLRALGS